MINNEKFYSFKLKEKNIIIALASAFILTFIGILLIDILDVAGIRTYLFNREFYMPFFWWHWFRNNGPFELMQFLFLGLGVIYTAKNTDFGSPVNRKFWYLFSIGLMLMLIEDAGSPRHLLRNYVEDIAGEAGYGMLGTLTELVYFGLLASVPLFAYFKYGRIGLKQYPLTKKYLLGGVVFYGAASGASFVGSAFSGLFDTDIYTLIGSRVVDLIVLLGGPDVEAQYLGQFHDHISFYIMDSPFEESLEIIGGALFLLAAVSYVRLHLESIAKEEIE